jgi:hypothetical protein
MAFQGIHIEHLILQRFDSYFQFLFLFLCHVSLLYSIYRGRFALENAADAVKDRTDIQALFHYFTS